MPDTENLTRANLLGVGIHAVNMPRVISLVEDALTRDGKSFICATGVHGIMEAQKDAGFRKILNSAYLNVPDGKPTVWIGRLQHLPEMGHVGGPELMLEICRMSVGKGFSHFLYGGNPGVVSELAAALERMFPGIKIVGSYTPPFRPLELQEEADLIRMVAAASPDILWVGISTPKQEKFMAEYLPKLNTKLMFGVGAAFNFHSGRVKFAPLWMRKAGLAWLFRFWQEPRRLWRRYLLSYPRFLWAMSFQLLGWRTWTLDRHSIDKSESPVVTLSDISR